MKKLLLAAAALGALSTASLAADLPSSKGPPIAPVVYMPAFTWTGFYVGLQGGYAWGDTNWRATTIAGAAVDNGTHDSSGWMFGGHVGYNQQIGQFVVGLEGDLEWANIRGNGTGLAVPPGTPMFHNTKIDWQGSVRARAGFAFDRALIYATGGVAFADVNHSYGSTLVAPAFATASYSDTKAGWTVGGGLEYAFTNNITGRAEYRYTDYGRISTTNAVAGLNVSSKVTTHAIRAGVSYKF